MLVIFAALQPELRACLGSLTGAREATRSGYPIVEGESVLVCQTGMGRRARDAVAALLADVSPRAVLSTGTAGGLSPELTSGDIVLCGHVTHESEGGLARADDGLTAAAIRVAKEGGHPVRVGSSVTVDELAWGPQEKSALRDGGHDIVEMESFWVGQAAAERGIPFLAVRVVSDIQGDSITEVPGLLDELGNVDAGALLAFARENPGMIAELGVQADRSRRALANLGSFLNVFLPAASDLLGDGR